MDWSDRLQVAFNGRYQEGKRRNVRFPVSQEGGAFEISGTASLAQVRLSARSVTANMQDNAAAFEIWCLALHAVCGVESVTLEWDLPEEETDPHYQRFLYRLRNFASLFDWLSIGHPDRLNASRLKPGSTLVLNAPAARLGSDDLDVKGEAALERACLRDPAFFEFFGCKRDGSEIANRQLPVGLFDQAVAKANAVFPGAKGAIDLYALQGECLWLFELKAGDNIPPGTLSEIFFYTCLMRDLCLGTIQPSHDEGRRIAEAKRIEAWIVGHRVHPLLDMELSPVLSELQVAIDNRWTGVPAVRLRAIALPGEGDRFVIPSGTAEATCN